MSTTTILPNGVTLVTSVRTFGDIVDGGRDASSRALNVPIGVLTRFYIPFAAIGFPDREPFGNTNQTSDNSIRLASALNPADNKWSIVVEINPKVAGSVSLPIEYIWAPEIHWYQVSYTTGVPPPPPPPPTGGGGGVFPVPAAVVFATLDTGPPGDTYTKIFNDTMGVAATPDDGYDAAFADAGAVSGAFGADLDALAASDPLAQAATAAAAFDVAPLDTSLAAFDGLQAKSNEVIANHAALAPPDLLELPIDPAFGSGIQPAPTQIPVDLGTLTLGSAALDYAFAPFRITSIGFEGAFNVALVNGDPDIFSLSEVLTLVQESQTVGHYVMHVTPFAVGVWQAQVNVTLAGNTDFTIVTFTVTVTA
jgi:hypothetical protein